jgi:4,5-dihydroxyphthalate decarboxylase
MAKKASKKKPMARGKTRKPAHRSPGKLRLSMMVGSYEIVRALKEGAVQPKDIELVVADYPGTRDIHDRVARGEACDINEFNGGAYVVQKHHGRGDITALPVFLHRRFRHGFIYVNTSGRIAKPAHLVGGRIACRTLGAAAHYWMRGILEQDFHVPHRDITWVIESDDEASLQAPADLKIERLPKGRKVEDMLLAGEVDAMLAPNVTRMIGEGDPRVGRLFPNYQELEVTYYRRTGLFPIMHVTTIASEIVARHPWVVESLVLAFEEAKQLAYQRLANPRNVPLAWWRTGWEEERALLGPDPWEYGLSELNKRNYDTLVGWVHEQVLTGRRPALEDLFPREAFAIELPLPRMHAIDHDRF